jgi:carbon storage regulator CsrA
MLVVKRKKNEVIDLHTSDGLVRILVVHVADKQVRVGIEAPQAVKVLRAELENEQGKIL